MTSVAKFQRQTKLLIIPDALNTLYLKCDLSNHLSEKVTSALFEIP